MSNSTGPGSSGRSGMSDFDAAEDAIKECYRRLEILEKKLRFQPMTDEERDQSEKDLIKLKDILKEQENDIRLIRKGNQTSTFIAVLLIFASFLIYGIYHMLKAEVPNSPIPKNPSTN